MQETQVRSLTQEDPTWHGATKPMRHNYWAWALEPQELQLLSQCAKAWALEPELHKRSHHNEKPTHRNREQTLLAVIKEKKKKKKPMQQRPSTVKNK